MVRACAHVWCGQWERERERERELRNAIKLCGKNPNGSRVTQGLQKHPEVISRTGGATYTLGALYLANFAPFSMWSGHFMAHFGDVLFPFVLLINAQTVYKANHNSDKTNIITSCHLQLRKHSTLESCWQSGMLFAGTDDSLRGQRSRARGTHVIFMKRQKKQYQGRFNRLLSFHLNSSENFRLNA
jgi:hypothetical protein